MGKIRHYVDHQTTKKLVHAFVLSRLDQCNSFLYGLPNVHLDKLQHVQNCATRLVTCNNKYTHIAPIQRELHWLPIIARIEYKIILLTYKSLKGRAPFYLRSLLSSYAPKRMLRSSAKHLLQTPIATTKAHVERSFSVAAPKLWNNLPDSFKKNLKTFLYKKHLS